MKLQPPELPQWLDDLWRAGAQGDGNGNGAEPGRPEARGKIPKSNPSRDATLFKMGCAMRNIGFTRDEIYHALQKVNAERCVPPLPDWVVQQKADQAGKYKVDDMAGVTIKEGSGRVNGSGGQTPGDEDGEE